MTRRTERVAEEIREEVARMIAGELKDPRIGFVTVTRVAGDMVTVDGNHPLAGEHLNFAVEVTEVRDATTEELSHGHVHGPGGHHHHG